MTFEEFKKCCSFDRTNINEGNSVQLLCIYSSGLIREFPCEFDSNNSSVSNDLVAHDLYTYLCKEFGNG